MTECGVPVSVCMCMCVVCACTCMCSPAAPRHWSCPASPSQPPGHRRPCRCTGRHAWCWAPPAQRGSMRACGVCVCRGGGPGGYRITTNHILHIATASPPLPPCRTGGLGDLLFGSSPVSSTMMRLKRTPTMPGWVGGEKGAVAGGDVAAAGALDACTTHSAWVGVGVGPLLRA